MSNTRTSLLRASAITVLLAGATIGSAGAADYTFEVAGPPVKAEAGWVTTVRLVGPTGQPVSNADVFYREFVQLNPKAMSGVLRRTPLASDGQGEYRLVTRQPVRAGTLPLDATVPGAGSKLYAQVPVRGE